MRHDCLVVSDLHLEKGSSFVSRGLTLPPYDSRTTLRNLQEVIARLRPSKVIALGDSFHDDGARGRLSVEEATTIQSLTKAFEWTWVVGNHDPRPPEDLGGSIALEVRLGALVLRHEPEEKADEGEVVGHFHPCAAIRSRGRRIRRRCFVFDDQKLVLPAFGAYTGGLNILDDAYASVLFGRPEVWLLGKKGAYKMSYSKLLPDPSQRNRDHARAVRRKTAQAR